MKVFAVLLLALAACNPGPAPVHPLCDYCRKPREDARPYICRKCGNSHSSCKVETTLHAVDLKLDKDGAAAGRSIKVCPNK